MKYIFFILILFFIFQCSFCDDCNPDMESKREKYGDPEEVNKYNSSGYHSVDWWYWTRGKEFTFTWGSDVEECCDVTSYTFTPIRNITAFQKDSILRASKTIIPVPSQENAFILDP